MQLATGTGMWPDQAKATRLGVDRIGWEARDPIIDPALNGGVNVLEAVRGNHFTLFLFRALWGWTGSPEGWADAFREDLHRLDLLKTATHPARQCALDADLVVDDSDWVLAALQRLRKILPGRGITWSFQPIKGGTIGDPMRDFINTDPWVTVAPFAYRNNMQPVSERAVVDDLLARKILPQKILIYYPKWCEGWNGFLYNLAEVT